MINKFQDLKYKLLLISTNQPSIPSLHFKQASLPINMGGLGIIDSNLTSHSASIASFLNSYEDIMYHFPTSNFQNNCSYNYLFDSIQFCNNNINNSDRDNFNFNQLITTYSKSNSPSLKIQNIISTKSLQFYQINFITSLQQIPGCHYLAWYTSVSDSTSGNYLLTSPKNPELIFSNTEFSTALSLRLHLTLPNIPPNKICTCKSNTIIDQRGYHLLTGCKDHGIRQFHHHNLQSSISSLLKYAGFANTVEETNCFRNVDPTNNCRPDITIHHPQLLDFNNELLLDVSLASPIEGIQKGAISNLSVLTASKKFRAGLNRFQSKMNKYSLMAKENNKSFLPFIMETSGSILPENNEFLKKVARIGGEKHHIPFSIFYNYMMKRISCSIQKSFCSKINFMISKIAIPIQIKKFVQNNIIDHVGVNILNSNPHYNINRH